MFIELYAVNGFIRYLKKQGDKFQRDFQTHETKKNGKCHDKK